MLLPLTIQICKPNKHQTVFIRLLSDVSVCKRVLVFIV